MPHCNPSGLVLINRESSDLFQVTFINKKVKNNLHKKQMAWPIIIAQICVLKMSDNQQVQLHSIDFHSFTHSGILLTTQTQAVCCSYWTLSQHSHHTPINNETLVIKPTVWVPLKMHTAASKVAVFTTIFCSLWEI